MWPKRVNQKNSICKILNNFSTNTRPLPGIAVADYGQCLSWQFIASIRRHDYTNILLNREINQIYLTPNDANFDPEKAAIWHFRNNNTEEAIWLIFLSIVFGKDLVCGWQRLNQVYFGLGTITWTWQEYSSNPNKFDDWLNINWNQIGGKFGNHRKYESLNPQSNLGVHHTLKSYLNWIGAKKSQKLHFAQIVQSTGNDPHIIFDKIFNEMEICRFGRLAKFDFLCLLGRLKFIPISPGSAYLADATGPKRGARLLFTGDPLSKVNYKLLQLWLDDLDKELNVGMQVIEDALCNWQKSPEKFIHFKG